MSVQFIVKQFEQLTTKELYEILKARCAVFTVEQKMNCQDLDDVDYKSFHLYLHEDGKIIAYFRAYYVDEEETTLQIGRCLTTVHGEGWGRELMKNAIWNLDRLYHPRKYILHAQKSAIGFYEKFAFKVVSDEYLEEGVIHQTMELTRAYWNQK